MSRDNQREEFAFLSTSATSSVSPSRRRPSTVSFQFWGSWLSRTTWTLWRRCYYHCCFCYYWTSVCPCQNNWSLDKYPPRDTMVFGRRVCTTGKKEMPHYSTRGESSMWRFPGSYSSVTNLLSCQSKVSCSKKFVRTSCSILEKAIFKKSIVFGK